MSEAVPALTISDPSSIDWSEWAAKHADGELPDSSPYNLGRLARSFEVDVTKFPPMTITRGLRMARIRARTSGHLIVAWDERHAVRAAAQFPDRPLASGVIWLTDRLPTMSTIERLAYRRVLSRAKMLWVLSDAQVEPLRAIVGAKPIINVLTFGIDVTYFEAAVRPEPALVLSLGNDRDRDVHKLVEALNLAHRNYPALRAVIQTAERLVVPDFITVAPKLAHREVKELYHRASVVALATRPNMHVSGMTTALEAGAASRPVVMTSTPGADTYVKNGETGMLMRTTEPSELARIVVDLLKDPGSAEQMGAAAHTHVSKNHRSSDMVERLASMLREVA